jgi:ABC-type glycerol-3-phosphate transport system substrate-binding protein
MTASVTRRGFLRLGAGLAGAAGLSAALGPCSQDPQERGLVMLSTQLRLAAEAEAGKGSVAVVTAQQADFSGLPTDKLIEDMTDRLQQLGDVPFNEDLLDLAKLEGILAFIPWVQGTYLMAAHKAALDHLPSGVEPSQVTYEQLTAWSRAIYEATGRRALGFPAGEDGLLYRFLQGYAYPSFTGGSTPPSPATTRWPCGPGGPASWASSSAPRR